MSKKQHADQSRRLTDHVVGSPELGPIRGLLATTYDLDPVFVEVDYLPSLLRLPAGDDHSIRSRAQLEVELARMEAAALLSEARRFQGRPRSLRVHVTPASGAAMGVLHAKVTLVVHSDAVRLLVSSANLTTSGYRENREVALAVVAQRKRLEERRLVRQALADMPLLLRSWWNEAAERVVASARSLLDGWGSEGDVDTDPDDRFVWGAPDRAIWRQFTAAWPAEEAVTAVKIVSPFWSEEGQDGQLARLLEGLRARGAKTDGADVLLVTQATAATTHAYLPTLPDSYRTFDFRTLGVNVSAACAKPQVEVEDTGRDDIARSRALHAKVVVVEGRKTTLAYAGSANFTGPGWGFCAPGHVNVEAGVVLRRKGKDGAALRLLVPPILGERQSLEGGGQPRLAPPTKEPNDTSWPAFVRGAELRASGEDARRLELRVLLVESALPAWWSLALGADLPERMSQGEAVAGDVQTLALSEDEVRTVYRNQAVYLRWEGMGGDEPVAYPVNATLEVREQIPFGDPEALPREDDLVAFYQGRIALEDTCPEPPGAEKEGGGPSSAALSEVDTSNILSYQIRSFVEALRGIQDELARNTATESSMRLALLGPVSPVALAKEIERAADRGRSSVAAGFQVTELIACLGRVRTIPVEDCLREAWVNAIREAEVEITGVLRRLTSSRGELGSGGAFDRYLRAILQPGPASRGAEVPS